MKQRIIHTLVLVSCLNLISNTSFSSVGVYSKCVNVLSSKSSDSVKNFWNEVFKSKGLRLFLKNHKEGDPILYKNFSKYVPFDRKIVGFKIARRIGNRINKDLNYKFAPIRSSVNYLFDNPLTRKLFNKRKHITVFTEFLIATFIIWPIVFNSISDDVHEYPTYEENINEFVLENEDMLKNLANDYQYRAALIDTEETVYEDSDEMLKEIAALRLMYDDYYDIYNSMSGKLLTAQEEIAVFSGDISSVKPLFEEVWNVILNETNYTTMDLQGRAKISVAYKLTHDLYHSFYYVDLILDSDNALKDFVDGFADKRSHSEKFDRWVGRLLVNPYTKSLFDKNNFSSNEDLNWKLKEHFTEMYYEDLSRHFDLD